MIDQVFFGVSVLADLSGLDDLPAQVRMGVDNGGHYGFAGEVDSRGACGGFDLAFDADLGDLAVLH